MNQNPSRFHIPRFLVATAVLLALLSQAVCSQQQRRDDLTNMIKQHAVWDPTQFVLDKLRTNRIVMVADFGHGVSLYYQIVISSLNSWASAWEQQSSPNSQTPLPRKLFLVLEMDSVAVYSLHRYFETSNPLDVMKPECFVGNQFTTSTLEFYDDLRRFKNRVDSLNRSPSFRDHIAFEIVGPEKVVDLTTWTQQWSEKYFVNERDEFSSARIQRLLENAPDAKALVYYGGAHLERQKSAKLGRNQGWGYYMAHYLSESFSSRGGVYTCGQLAVRSISWVDPAIAMIGRTFAIDNSFLKGAAIAAGTSFIAVDGVIFHDKVPTTPRHISSVLSENLVNLALGGMKTYNDSAKQYYRYILLNCMYYLARQAPRDWTPERLSNVRSIDSAITAWNDWRKSSTLDFVDDISSLSYFKRLVDQIGNVDSRQSTQYQDLLAQLGGFTVWLPPDASANERMKATLLAVNKYRKEIVIENLIHLLWVGTPSETRKAMSILTQETGQAFTTAKEWTSWWRSQYTN